LGHLFVFLQGEKVNTAMVRRVQDNTSLTVYGLFVGVQSILPNGMDSYEDFLHPELLWGNILKPKR
jgi:hypothetical protein